eukprot:scaffold255345_cov17-Tisochrysis_lutea.AAC.1
MQHLPRLQIPSYGASADAPYSPFSPHGRAPSSPGKPVNPHSSRMSQRSVMYQGVGEGLIVCLVCACVCAR